MSAWLAPGEIIIAIGIAGHDPEENEDDDRDARERDERHQETPEDRKRDHRFVTPSPNRGPSAIARDAIAIRPLRRPATPASAARAPDLFGMTLRSDL